MARARSVNAHEVYCTVGVDQEAGLGGPVADGHVQGAGDQRGGLGAVDGPPDDPAGEGVQYDLGYLESAAVCRVCCLLRTR